ncbi:MAG: hypothetical protein WDA10_11720 [Porticoccaceae bacterium]|jgi:hypothetical protein|nr:hypothetical protein [Porticoccaceae bacterium]MEA3298611.1 hypothetical protein [Pseudomonadota bacterium]
MGWLSRLPLALALLALPALANAHNLTGNGTITPQEQQALEYYIGYFGRASVFVREYCIFDQEGNPKNNGTCKTEVPRLPGHAVFGSGGKEAEYARQFRGMAMGEVIADPKMNLVYVHSFPEVWIACNNRRAYGCTYTHKWPRQVTVIVSTYDKKLGDITLTHEIEYHVKRDIKH